MDAPEPMTLARNVAVDDDDGILESHPSPKVDGGVVLDSRSYFQDSRANC